MGRLRVLSGRETCRLLQQRRFREARRRGSHIVMQPVPDHPELAIGTLLAISRQSGIPRAAFETSR